MAKEKEEEVKTELKYELGQIITGTAPAILLDGKAITESEALVLILNKLEEINKKV